MKKLLLASTALLGLVAAATPAAAEINMDLGGHFRGYGVYNDNDGANLREFDFRRDTEIHFTGEATSDNGLTVGAHYEGFVGGDISTDEAYAYFSGNWGRANFGSEDGAAYLLQVAAPSADSNVDGLRTNIQAVNATGNTVAGTALLSAGFDTAYTGVFSDRFGTAAGLATGSRMIDYDHADFQDTERLTYLSPKYMGFQGGLSYAPEAGQKVIGNGLVGAATDNDADDFENLWEAAARWDGEFEGFGISAGAGYSTAEVENEGTAANAAGVASDDLDSWNVGLNVAFQGFSVGGAWLNSETQVGNGGAAGNDDLENDTWTIGAAWDNGPYHVGVSYLDSETDLAAESIETDRTTVGAGYTYGPGMSFRGAVAFGSVEEDVGAANTDEDFTQVTVGTDIQF